MGATYAMPSVKPLKKYIMIKFPLRKVHLNGVAHIKHVLCPNYNKVKGVLQDCYILQKIKTRKIIHALKQKKWSEKNDISYGKYKKIGYNGSGS